MAKRYTIAGQIYETQSRLEERIKTTLQSHPMNQPFSDEFLAAVINTEHEEVKAAGQQATGLFQYLDHREQIRRGLDTAQRFRGGNLLLGFFEPLCQWRDVTVYPWRGRDSPRQDIKRALREILALHLPRPTIEDRCARAGCSVGGLALEYHHVDPEFDVIAEECLNLASEDEIGTKFGYSKFVPGRDELIRCIPDNHPMVRRLIETHEHNRWEWLCKMHHRNVGVR